METTNESLKQQFQLLQEQQQKKLLRRKQRKEEQAKEKTNLEKPEEKTFGVDDNLDLKTKIASCPVCKNYAGAFPYFSSSEFIANTTLPFSSLSLDSESDTENSDDPLPKGSSYVSEELVQHLNDQIRELKGENGRVYKLLSEKDFEIRALKKKKNEESTGVEGLTNETAASKIVELSKKVRELTAELESEKTKSKQFKKKCHDLQQQLSNIPEEARSLMGSAVSLRTLQLEEKVLSQEVGENVNVQSLLSGNTNWRGRAQQIIMLQKKKAAAELKALEEDYAALKNKFDASKVRLSDRPASIVNMFGGEQKSSDPVSQSRQSVRPPSGRPASVSNAERQMIHSLQNQCQEYRTIMQATEVEREKLSELVQVLQNRHNETCQKLTNCQNELANIRKRNVPYHKEKQPPGVREQ
ncbi:hypothetical protein KUTeg_014951 [Tegillarca granosa]|uniref:Coiled-coil domain-containing protein 13 n=1 Tax=Tegillarca granosa TaxID=220873 RepID=A0ABQ9ETF4_TEGGR|nr:hypothetical protein KUTeg_014951 [Tegillarca granosa]